ncbi:MAG: FAD-dependent tricarballylate dehydrogenase TcuA, partial [Trebonia sp.]
RQNGAERVIVLEKAPVEESGGNARFSHTGFRWAYLGADEIREFLPDIGEAEFRKLVLPGYSEDDFRADLMRVTEGRIDAELAEVLVTQSNAAVHWMLDTGIKWEHETGVVIGGLRYFEPGGVIHPVGGNQGGIRQVQQWVAIAEGLGVEIRYQSAVTALHGNMRHVEGVEVSAPDRTYDLAGKAVILCAGGFQANAEMRARYLGANTDLMKVRGSKHDTGEILQMALALGAKPSGQWQGAHGSPIDANAPNVGSGSKVNRYGYPYGITVNSLGRRFFDEGESFYAFTYAKTGRRVLSQPGAVAYQIFDQQSIPLLTRRHYDHATPIDASTIEELAKKIGVEPDVLSNTVEEFNSAVRDDVEFDPSRLDGRTAAGIDPPKSNWALHINEPPYRAYMITGGITFTFGGLKVNADAQVVNHADEPITGLYASGDILGLFYHNYPGFSGQTRNVVFGRLAGAHIASAHG